MNVPKSQTPVSFDVWSLRGSGLEQVEVTQRQGLKAGNASEDRKHRPKNLTREAAPAEKVNTGVTRQPEGLVRTSQPLARC